MKPLPRPTLALIPIARPTFDTALAEQVTAQLQAQLQSAGIRPVGPGKLVSTLDEARQAAQSLVDSPPDLLLIFQATFADSTMALELARMVDAPLLLWAVPEERGGGRLRLNSLCGINLAGHGLTRAGYRYEYIYAPPNNSAALSKLQAVLRAGQVRRQLQQARLGRIGAHPDGFDTCRFDATALKQQLGVEVVQVELAHVFQQAQNAPAPQLEAVTRQLGQTLENLADMDSRSVRGTLGAYLSLKELSQTEQLAGLAVRCWPEFFTELGCAACGAMSMLSNEHTPCSCEADVNGAITQLVLQWLSGQPAFGSDLVAVDVDENIAILWHCGLAPLAMANPAQKPRATIHSNRQLPLLMEFTLKPGRVTLARLSQATGSLRLVVGGGQMIEAPPAFTGTTGALRFDRPAAQVLDTIMHQGLEHHLSLTYGDHVEALLALAKMLDIPVLHL